MQHKSVNGKVLSGLVSLRKLKNILLQLQLFDVYRVPLESHLRYDNVVWGEPFPAPNSALCKNTRRAFSLTKSSNIKDAYNGNVLDVSELITFNREVITFKIINQLCPEGLRNKLIERSALSNYNYRNMKNLHV